MSEEMLDAFYRDEFSAIAVIVLYKLRPSESAAFRSLKTAIERLDQTTSRFRVLLVDNTPGEQDPGPLPENFRYTANMRNAGLAAAYNQALAIASAEGIGWLLTLDQDTSLPPDYLVKMRSLALHWQENQSIGAIVPLMKGGAAVISPLYVDRLRNSPVPEGFEGLSERELYALNSASLLSVDALRQIGGFCEEFWLDQLDLVLHHQLHRAGKRIYVAGNIQVQHELSLQDYRSLSTDRFQNFLQSESAFFDIYKGVAENQILTATLLFRYFKHKAKGTNPAITEQIFQALRRRILCSRRDRIAQWRQGARERVQDQIVQGVGQTEVATRPRISVCMASCNGERFIEAQLRSILSQLASHDEVIVVDDASTDATCRTIENLSDARIRLTARKTNLGVLRTFEEAIQQAQGEIIFLTDQDDLWMPDKVSVILDAFRSNPEADIVVSDAALINQEGAPIGASYYAALGGFKSGILANIFHCSYLGCTMTFRAWIRSRILPFPERADILHDLWIGASNSISGGKAFYVDRPLVLYRRHENNATGNRRLSLGRQLRIRWDLCRSLARPLLTLNRSQGE